MPNAPRTPARAVRVEDGLWQDVRRESARSGETVSDVIRRALRAYLAVGSGDALSSEVGRLARILRSQPGDPTADGLEDTIRRVLIAQGAVVPPP